MRTTSNKKEGLILRGIESTKICIVGAPSTRKTTTAEQLKINLKLEGHIAEIVPEYARTYIRKYGKPEHVAEQIMITQGQIDAENEVQSAHPNKGNIIICDSASFLGYVYSELLESRSNLRFRAIRNQIHQMALEHLYTYNYVFFSPIEAGVELVQDGVRYQNKDDWTALSKKIQAFLELERPDYHTIHGSVDAKAKWIKNFLKEEGVLK